MGASPSACAAKTLKITCSFSFIGHRADVRLACGFVRIFVKIQPADVN